MRELRTEINIAAPLIEVWNIIIDFDNWSQWNPISKASGSADLGSKLNITMLDKDGKDSMKYKAIITEFKQPSLFRWRAKMMAGFLFTNDKIFELEEIDTGTRLIHREEFSGLMVPMFWSKLNEGCIPMFNSMNEALKLLAEKKNI